MSDIVLAPVLVKGVAFLEDGTEVETCWHRVAWWKHIAVA